MKFGTGFSGCDLTRHCCNKDLYRSTRQKAHGWACQAPVGRMQVGPMIYCGNGTISSHVDY